MPPMFIDNFASYLQYGAWPLVVVLVFATHHEQLGVLLTKLAEFIGRATEAKIGNLSASASLPDQKPFDRSADDLGTSVANAPPKTGTPTTFDNESPCIKVKIEEVEKYLLREAPNDNEEQLKILKRSLAHFWQSAQFESVSSVIFGTQLNFIVALNSYPNGMGYHEVEPFFREHLNRLPENQRNREFAQWIGYLLNARLVEVKNDKYFKAPLGHEFVSWIWENGKTSPRGL